MRKQTEYLRLKEEFEMQCRELVGDPNKFSEYLRFSGRFYKLPPTHTTAIMSANPNSTMVADYDTWQKYHRQVKRGSHGIPVAIEGKIGYYFDISATSGKSVPYQWSLDKETATKYIEHYNAISGKQSRTFSGCIDRMSNEAADNIAEKAAKDLDIPKENFYKFKSSFASIICHNVAARCEWGGSYKYKSNPLDLSALKMIKPERAEMFIEFAQMTSKTVLSQMEKEINVINAERSIENERARRNQTDLVRRGQDVLPGIQDGERQDVQAPPEMVRVSGRVSADTRTGRADERADRTLRETVAEVYGGNVSRTSGTNERLRSGLGTDTSQDRQAGTGTVRHSEGGISTENSSPDNVHGNIRMGGNIQTDVDTSRGNGADISAVGGRGDFDRSEFGQIPVLNEEDNSHKEQEAEVNSSAFSFENLPTITCEWSESSVFEDGKTYSVYEFDRLMKQADDERVAGAKAAIEKYGSLEKLYNSKDEDFIRLMRYDKVKFTVNLPYGTSFTERQDIGDGYGGVIDFLSRNYGSVIPILKQARDAEKPITESKEPLEKQREQENIGEQLTLVENQIDLERAKVDEFVAVDIAHKKDINPQTNDQNTSQYPRSERDEKPIESAEKHDFIITDEHLGEGGQKSKYAANIAAIKVLKAVESENRLATPAEQETLSKYVGWGGIPQAFDDQNQQWKKEYAELKGLLTDEEYTSARASTPNAHYTSPEVIKAIYKGLENLGFEGGNILEPAMGVGYFFGAMPENIRENSRLKGSELDSISGRIAQQLYQNADIQVKGFEKSDFSDNYFDAAIGNVPFGSYSVADKRYDKEHFLIHDYFFAKALDKVAPNGIIAFITSKGTLDKANTGAREYIAKRADLIGAIRLPNNAFKGVANTEVTTDIIFLRKREKMAVELPDWCYTSNNSDGIPVNNYYIEHPEMILGKMEYSEKMYGNVNDTTCTPIEGAVLSEQLEKAVSRIHAEHIVHKREERSEKERGVIPATDDVRNFTFGLVDGEMYYRENNIMTKVRETGTKLERMKGMHELRNTMRTLITAQSEGCSDEELAVIQGELNRKYDDFIKQFGSINSSPNKSVFCDDDDYNTLSALENVNSETKTVEKTDIFFKRTIKPVIKITKAENEQEAMQISLDLKGRLDIPYMAELCGKNAEDICNQLISQELIYLDPEKYDPDNSYEGYEEASEYLSGNVREKLRTAQAAAKNNEMFARNVAALEKTLPPTITAGEITARIGVPWVDTSDYTQFLREYAKANINESIIRTYNGEYKVPKTYDCSIAATSTYGTKRMRSYEIFENLLNNRGCVVRDKTLDNNGNEKYVVNRKETELAAVKAKEMKEAFKRWLWEDPARREKYVTRYNELFNSIVGREYDGSHQSFPQMSPSIKLNPHQQNAVMRAKFGGNTLLAHCVGAGKSFEMVAATMEKKRLGLINKACVVVPKHLVGQMAAEWMRLYPQAHILTATEKDFTKDRRQKFIGRCCTGNYDAVIMSYQQFEKIPMSMEYRESFLKKELAKIEKGLIEARTSHGSYLSIKDLEIQKKRVKAKIEKLLNAKEKDTSLCFEELGFDALIVDEAHNYKNGLVFTKMNNVAGVQSTPAQKSEDILMKTQWLNENHSGNIIFATGTPYATPSQQLQTA